MDQTAPRKDFTKPIGGFVVVLAVALFVGGWLYVDMVKNELEMKVESVAADLRAVRAARKAAEEKEAAPSAETKMRTYAAGLGDYRFQIDLPEGWRLVPQENEAGEVNGYLVVADPTPENESPMPDMIIAVASTETDALGHFGEGPAPKLRTVPVPNTEPAGTLVFALRGWEDQEWALFDEVASSFKPL